MNRQLPASPEAEQHVLGCCLVDAPETITRCVSEKLTHESFYVPSNKVIFEVMVAMWSAGTVLDLATLTEELQARKQLDAVGGLPYLMQLGDGVPTTAHASYFIAKVLALHQLREIIRVGTTVVERAYGANGDATELIGELQAQITSISTLAEPAEPKIQKVAAELHAEVESFIKTGIPKRREVVSWGLVDLDRICRPLEVGELVVVGGRPSTGKSALADQVAWQTAAKGGETLLFSYEMTKREKAIRIAQQISGCNYNQLPTLPKDRQKSFTDAFARIRDCPHLHVFERDTALARLSARARAFASRSKVALIVVDFLQYLARLEATVGKERTDEKIGRITATLKDLAKHCSCPVLMLASLNREGEREGRPPRMSDLRASGEIESDADVIALLHWPATSPRGASQDPHDESQTNFYVEFNQEKGRNKGVHQVGLHFDRNATRFSNYIDS